MRKGVYWVVAIASVVAPLVVGVSAREWASVLAERFEVMFGSLDALPQLSSLVINQPSVLVGAMAALSVAVLIAHIVSARRIKTEENRLLAWGVISAFAMSGALVCSGTIMMGYCLPMISLGHGISS